MHLSSACIDWEEAGGGDLDCRVLRYCYMGNSWLTWGASFTQHPRYGKLIFFAVLLVHVLFSI
jgi:hypothetical protein